MYAEFYAVRLIKKKLKVGHAGTLDPLATGVMVLCTGKATKRIEELQYGVKEYIATLQLGATTPSFDLEHPIDQTYPTEHITRELVDETIKRFVGEIWQVPPVYSAVKIDGKRAFDYARKGREAEGVRKNTLSSADRFLNSRPGAVVTVPRDSCMPPSSIEE